MIDAAIKQNLKFISPKDIRANPVYYAKAISRIQGQALYKDITSEDVFRRITRTPSQRKEDNGIFDYAVLEHNTYGPIATTSTITYTEQLPKGHKLHPKTTYLTLSNGVYQKTKLENIIDTSPPLAEITGLARDKEHRGDRYGQKLSEYFTAYLQETEQEKLITRFSLGKYADGYTYSEPKTNLENLIQNTGETLTQQDIQEHNIPGLPYVHPISVPAAKEARNQEYKAVAIRIPNKEKGSAEGHGGPIWIPETSNRTKMPIQHIKTLLGERNGTYTTLS